MVSTRPRKEIKKEKPERQLRSKDIAQKQPNKTLFNFDNVNEHLQGNKPIKLTDTTGDENRPYVFYGESGNVPDLPPHTDTLKIVEPLLPRRSQNRDDPLPDSLYEVFYKKMKKEEKVMTNEERLRILSEVDSLQDQLKLLHQYDWIRHLRNIASINNPNDYEELQLKRDLSIAEIRRLLRKHDNWRRRYDTLNNDIRENIGVNDGSELSDDPDYECSIEELRDRRKLERAQRYGPVIRLNLSEKYSLVIDPVAPPKIVEVEPPNPIRKVESPNHIAKVEKPIETKPEPIDTVSREMQTMPASDIRIQTNAMLSSTGIPKSKVWVYRQNLEEVENVNEIDFQIKDSTHVFGTSLERLEPTVGGFKMPHALRKRNFRPQKQ
ncbi:uncharacterized protein J8A68_004768 [[Candida] subhashii]|uniref:Something about silencing protein 4 domain-containing protein n=1 Tax=[Candida] subhashii TaxID=561895 RepID=A0A8J5QI11_9ASCO|nr:uncharacterized protein J8A68_004768 [[Candida] subhashii]KAG7661710.1 hypothetical protein J8A68_004768 [[Candida] subhashii]